MSVKHLSFAPREFSIVHPERRATPAANSSLTHPPHSLCALKPKVKFSLTVFFFNATRILHFFFCSYKNLPINEKSSIY